MGCPQCSSRPGQSESKNANRQPLKGRLRFAVWPLWAKGECKSRDQRMTAGLSFNTPREPKIEIPVHNVIDERNDRGGSLFGEDDDFAFGL
jgi:hypothetical protein